MARAGSPRSWGNGTWLAANLKQPVLLCAGGVSAWIRLVVAQPRGSSPAETAGMLDELLDLVRASMDAPGRGWISARSGEPAGTIDDAMFANTSFLLCWDHTEWRRRTGLKMPDISTWYSTTFASRVVCLRAMGGKYAPPILSIKPQSALQIRAAEDILRDMRHNCTADQPTLGSVGPMAGFMESLFGPRSHSMSNG
jgi:hypothetical protein